MIPYNGTDKKKGCKKKSSYEKSASTDQAKKDKNRKLDAAEFYNNEGSSKWMGSAYAKFSYESIPAEATITNATLTYNTNQGGGSGRTEKIYYMAKDFDLDWANFAGQKNVDLSYSANRVSSISVATGGTGDREN